MPRKYKYYATYFKESIVLLWSYSQIFFNYWRIDIYAYLLIIIGGMIFLYYMSAQVFTSIKYTYFTCDQEDE